MADHAGVNVAELLEAVNMVWGSYAPINDNEARYKIVEGYAVESGWRRGPALWTYHLLASAEIAVRRPSSYIYLDRLRG